MSEQEYNAGRKAELASVAEAFASQFSLERVEGNAHRLNWADGSAISDIYVRQLVSNYLLARYRTLNPDYDAAQTEQSMTDVAPESWRWKDQALLMAKEVAHKDETIEALETELALWKSLRPGWDIAEVDKALQDGEAAHNLWKQAEAEIAALRELADRARTFMANRTIGGDAYHFWTIWFLDYDAAQKATAPALRAPPFEMVCPDCLVERADYEGAEHQWLPLCPNCGSVKDPEPRNGWQELRAPASPQPPGA